VISGRVELHGCSVRLGLGDERLQRSGYSPWNPSLRPQHFYPRSTHWERR